MDIEGDVLQHVETVSHGNAGEDEVDRVGLHVLVGEHKYVDHIEHTTKQTDQQRQVAMYGDVDILATRKCHLPYIERLELMGATHPHF